MVVTSQQQSWSGGATKGYGACRQCGKLGHFVNNCPQREVSAGAGLHNKYVVKEGSEKKVRLS